MRFLFRMALWQLQYRARQGILWSGPSLLLCLDKYLAVRGGPCYFIFPAFLLPFLLLGLLLAVRNSQNLLDRLLVLFVRTQHQGIQGQAALVLAGWHSLYSEAPDLHLHGL